MREGLPPPISHSWLGVASAPAAAASLSAWLRSCVAFESTFIHYQHQKRTIVVPS